MLINVSVADFVDLQSRCLKLLKSMLLELNLLDIGAKQNWKILESELLELILSPSGTEARKM